MMALIIQLLFSVGPIALAIMGVVVSLSPPNSTFFRNLWMASFIIIGAVSVAAIFIEVRGTDNTLALLEKNSHHGPRFEFAGFKVREASDNNMQVSANFSNTSDIDASAYRLVILIGAMPHFPDLDDLNKVDSDLSKINLQSPVNGTAISRGMGVETRPVIFNKDDIAKGLEQGKSLFFLAVAEYAPTTRDQADYWRTEVCAKITKPLTGFEPCPRFNRYLHIRDGKEISD